MFGPYVTSILSAKSPVCIQTEMLCAENLGGRRVSFHGRGMLFLILPRGSRAFFFFVYFSKKNGLTGKKYYNARNGKSRVQSSSKDIIILCESED